MMDTTIRIRVLKNGYILEYDDPEIRRKNREPKSEWQDAGRSISFTKPKEVADALGKLLPLMEEAAEDTEQTEFDQALTEALKLPEPK